MGIFGSTSPETRTSEGAPRSLKLETFSNFKHEGVSPSLHEVRIEALAQGAANTSFLNYLQNHEEIRSAVNKYKLKEGVTYVLFGDSGTTVTTFQLYQRSEYDSEVRGGYKYTWEMRQGVMNMSDLWVQDKRYGSSSLVALLDPNAKKIENKPERGMPHFAFRRFPGAVYHYTNKNYRNVGQIVDEAMSKYTVAGDAEISKLNLHPERAPEYMKSGLTFIFPGTASGLEVRVVTYNTHTKHFDISKFISKDTMWSANLRVALIAP
jgi:hypothetical protein